VEVMLMSEDFNKDLCEERHMAIKEDINHINKRLDGHDDAIETLKDENTKSHFELREAITEIKNCITLLTQNQTNKTEISKSKIALYGVIITAIFSLITSVSVVVVTNLIK
jgi:tetrahydromethanopterin S-methyltransferase subunit G